GQKLLVPAAPEIPPAHPGDIAPPLPAALPSSFTTEPRRAPVAPPSPPPLPARSRRRYDNDYDDEDPEDDVPALRQRRRGYYPLEVSVKSATTGLTCSLISLALLIAMFVLWVVAMQSPRMRFGGGPTGGIVVVILLLTVVSLVIAIMSIVYS